jgi:hypothetical protein
MYDPSFFPISFNISSEISNRYKKFEFEENCAGRHKSIILWWFMKNSQLKIILITE